jgi:SAM-dependent methyltransferase
VQLLLQELEGRGRPRAALDIGCGQGIVRDPGKTRLVREAVDDFWGIEPDSSMTAAKGLFDHFQNSLMETAALPENHFDLAYSFMVVEHVADPAGFLRAVHRSLKPGGVFVFATVNAKHYFTRIAKAMHAARIDERVLRLVRGKALTEAYHYEVQYRCNSRRAIERAAAEAGFETPLIAYLEDYGARAYFPGPLRPAFWALNAKRRVWKRREALLTLFARMRKRQEA